MIMSEFNVRFENLEEKLSEDRIKHFQGLVKDSRGFLFLAITDRLGEGIIQGGSTAGLTPFDVYALLHGFFLQVPEIFEALVKAWKAGLRASIPVKDLDEYEELKEDLKAIEENLKDKRLTDAREWFK